MPLLQSSASLQNHKQPNCAPVTPATSPNRLVYCFIFRLSEEPNDLFCCALPPFHGGWNFGLLGSHDNPMAEGCSEQDQAGIAFLWWCQVVAPSRSAGQWFPIEAICDRAPNGETSLDCRPSRIYNILTTYHIYITSTPF